MEPNFDLCLGPYRMHVLVTRWASAFSKRYSFDIRLRHVIDCLSGGACRNTRLPPTPEDLPVFRRVNGVETGLELYFTKGSAVYLEYHVGHGVTVWSDGVHPTEEWRE